MIISLGPIKTRVSFFNIAQSIAMIITVIYWPEMVEFVVEDGGYTGRFKYDYNLNYLGAIESYNPP